LQIDVNPLVVEKISMDSPAAVDDATKSNPCNGADDRMFCGTIGAGRKWTLKKQSIFL